MNTPPPLTASSLPPIPNSPSYSFASTNPSRISAYGLPNPPPPLPTHAILTKNDLESSQAAYLTLLESAKTYRLALSTLSTSASSFGSALESCARLKEARSDSVVPLDNAGLNSLSNSFSLDRATCTADNLLAASGIHQLIANHQQILAETVYRSFEVPLMHELDGWRRRVEEDEITHQNTVKTLSRDIQKLEREGLKLHRARRKDVNKLRRHLVDLTERLDGLTMVHAGHSRGLLRECQETSGKIVEASSSLVRAEVELFEALARKGWVGGGLEGLFDAGRDLFADEDDTEHLDDATTANSLFSILPQKSILLNPDTKPISDNKPIRHDSFVIERERYQSLTGAVRDGKDSTTETSSMFSGRGTEGQFNQPRPVRPFSPPPPLTRVMLAFDSQTSNPLSSSPEKAKPIPKDSDQNSQEDADQRSIISQQIAEAMQEDDESRPGTAEKPIDLTRSRNGSDASVFQAEVKTERGRSGKSGSSSSFAST